MRSLLFVPKITKNLMFVSKFAKDNQVLFEFFPNKFQVQDLRTKEVLLQVSIFYGLYRLNLPPASKPLIDKLAQCFTAARIVPLDVWHSRLGHLCLATLKKALHRCNVLFLDNNVPCVSCHLGKEHK